MRGRTEVELYKNYMIAEKVNNLNTEQPWYRTLERGENVKCNSNNFL